MVGEVSSVHAVVVTFNPDCKDLLAELKVIYDCVDRIWVVDNGSSNRPVFQSLVQGLGHKVEIIELMVNFGLAVGQNKGIRLARNAGASHIIFLDQDSEPIAGMVSQLLQSSDRLEAAGELVGLVAPIYEDRSSGVLSGFIRFAWLDYSKTYPSPDDPPMVIDFAISSGSLVPVKVIDQVGLMDEALFIDHVDTEWCLRAKSKGFKLYGVPSARMLHSLGVNRRRVWLFRWRNIPCHSPFRYYYIFRNGALLMRRAYVPWRWRVGEIFRWMAMLVYFGLFGNGRLKKLSLMLKGLSDGFKGMSGRMPESRSK